MPELPEVETVVRGLRAAVQGRRITGVRFGKTDFIENPAAIEASLPGARIGEIERYGKFISVRLEPANGSGRAFYLAIHLGMTGQIVARRADEIVPPHTHAFLALDDGREIRYTDIRRFGSIRLLEQPPEGMFQRPLGHDPLEASEAEFRTLLAGRRAMIKALLLDQHALRGMGNIYVDESLWRARIHPQRHAARLSAREGRELYRAIQKVLRSAIRLRGSSISDYLDAEGRPGSYHLQHRVYQREGKPCARCRTRIRRVIVAGRSSYFCAKCQKAPRLRRPETKKDSFRRSR
jgi:formamidopyrimidine-DNA glycosylase